MADNANERECKCGHQWSQHIGKYGEGYVICAARRCKCTYREIIIARRRIYGVRKEALSARRKDQKRDKFYLEMAVERELNRRTILPATATSTASTTFTVDTKWIRKDR